MDAIAAAIRRCGQGGVLFSAVITWAEREHGILGSKALELVHVLVKSGEIRHDKKSDRLYYLQKRGTETILAAS